MISITTTPNETRPTGGIIPAVQVAATLGALALPIGNLGKLAAFAAIWTVTFRRASFRELVCYAAICTLFSVMDIMAVHKGVFRFADPDVAGLPFWEFFMWGFLVLHVLRTVGGPPPAPRLRLVVPLAVLFAAPFSTIADPTLLLAVSATLLAIALVFLHDRWDIRYLGYAILLGAAFEYVGVWSGQWEYPRHPIGGVEPWFVTMWGGIGLFARRLILPLLSKSTPPSPDEVASSAG